MKLAVSIVAVAGSLFLTAPAMAQLVNGGSGVTPTAEAPVGTKSGGSAASLEAPGGADAAASATVNAANHDARVTNQTDATVKRTDSDIVVSSQVTNR